MRPLTLALLLLATVVFGCADEKPNSNLWDCKYPVTVCQEVIAPGHTICVAGPKVKEPTDDTD